MKNKNWRRIAIFSSMALMSSVFFLFGIAFASYSIFSFLSDIVIRVFNLSPEQSAHLFTELMQHMGEILR